MRLIKASIVCLAIELAGCASGVKYKDMAASIPPVAPDMGRIFFYRARSMMGAAVQPSIMLDGVKVGNSQPGGFFYVDRAPGAHEISVATEVERKRTLNLALKEIKYVKTSLDFGFVVGRPAIDVVDPEAGVQDLPDLSYTGDQNVAVAAGANVKGTPAAVTTTAVAVKTAAPAVPAADGAPAANPAPAFAGGRVETWNGLMSCDARTDNMPHPAYASRVAYSHMRAAYEAKFDVEVAGNAVRMHRQPAQVTESLSGLIADGKLTLSGEGYRLDTPDAKWQIDISGAFPAGSPAYSGRGNMRFNGSTVRHCELTMTRAAISSN